MDAREWEQSQSRRSSIKRPWDEDAIPPQGSSSNTSSWNGAILPPIEGAPHRRPSIHQAIEPPVGAHHQFMLEGRETATKKPKYEGDDFRPSSRADLGLSLSTEFPQSRRLSHSIYPPQRDSSDSSSFPHQHRREAWERQGGDASGGPAASHQQNAFHTSNICPRCRRLTTQQQDLEVLEPSEGGQDSRAPELALVAQAAAAQLTKALRTLSSAERRSFIRDQGFERHDFESDPANDSPPIARLGLKPTLDWILGKLYLVNELADKLAQNDSPGLPPQLDKHSPRHGTNPQDGLHYSMKRRIDAEPDESFRSRNDGADPGSDSKVHTRRKSIPLPGPDELSSLRPQNEYASLHSSGDGSSRRGSIMNPPPAPGRQLPSPPGRSFPSPTSINFPSPSAASYVSSSQSVNLPGPSSLHSASYLPPIGSSQSDSALQTHSAALQHEVSVQKIALSSLQGEHDKLLAAFSRSQLRASALEKKHAVSDNEIITLSEERIQLQAKVAELEKDVEDLTRSRDEYRQAAVQESSQYIEIVKKASRLEEMASEERKQWNTSRTEMEAKIVSLSGTVPSRYEPEPASSTGDNTPTIDMDTPASSIDGPPIPPIPYLDAVKLEPNTSGSSTSGENRSVALPHPIPTSNPPPSTLSFHPHPQQDQTKDLKEEIRRLRIRCTEAEDTLRLVREGAKDVEGMVMELGLKGRMLAERVDRTLGVNRPPSES